MISFYVEVQGGFGLLVKSKVAQVGSRVMVSKFGIAQVLQ